MPPLLLPLLATVGVTGFAATVVANVAVLGLTFAVQAGLSTYQQRLAKKKARRNYQAPTQTIKGASEPRRRSFGKVGRLGGYLAFAENVGYDSYLLIVFNQGTITEFSEFYLGDKQVLLDADGCVTTPPFWRGGGTVDTRSWVRIEAHRGFADQPASPMLMARFPEWTADHKLNGCAYVVVKFTAVPQSQFQNVYSSTMPDLSSVYKAEAVFDPRDPAQSITDPDSWVYSANSALCILCHLITHDGMGVALGAVDLGSFATAADRCDDLIALKSGGTEPRYRCSVTYNFDEPPDQVLERKKDTCGGEFYLTPEGKIGLHVASPHVPAVELTDDDIVSLDYDRGNGLLKQYNTLVPKFVSPQHGWMMLDGPFISDAAAVTELGRVIKEQTELPYVTSCTQAQRLARMELYDNNPLYTGEAVCHLTALKIVGEPIFRLRSEKYGLNIICRCTGLSDDDSATVTVRWESPSPERDLWDANIHEQPAPVIPANTSDDPMLPEAPHDFSFSTETDAGVSITGVRWQTKLRDGQKYTFRWREYGTTTWAVGSDLVDPACAMTPVTLATNYEVQARVLTLQGGISPWGEAQVTPANYTAGPIAAPTLTATGGAGTITISLTQSATAHAWSIDYVVMPSGTAVNWAGATTRTLAPSQAVTFDMPHAAGAFDVFARSRSVAGAVASATVGPVAVTVTEVMSSGGGGGGSGDTVGTGGGSGATGGFGAGSTSDPGNSTGTGLW